MPTLVIERFTPPAGTRRDMRTRAYCGERAAHELADRTVWCLPELQEPLTRLLEDRAAVRTYADALVGPDDIVLLDDAQRAPEIRERGAHAVVPVRRRPARTVAGVDAYLIAWSTRGMLAYRMAAVLPRSGRVSEKDMDAAGDALAWGSLLADVVNADRDEHVGGRRHARPAVAVH
jgi:hypothetical protein